MAKPPDINPNEELYQDLLYILAGIRLVSHAEQLFG